ncbi:MAG: 30S ribosomal protein S6, partial [Lachnospiraceae bacterium]|nr:30S ribosomal protein S6 [Lachnospiraceae bacterium]
MNKYELCVVLSAKIEDDERAATLEKVQKYITRFGGT